MNIIGGNKLSKNIVNHLKGLIPQKIFDIWSYERIKQV